MIHKGETVKERVEKLKDSINQIISDFRNDTGILPTITITNEHTGPCEYKVVVSVDEELLPLAIY